MNLLRIFIRWVDLYKWRILIACIMISFSFMLVVEPFWFIAAADSLRIVYAIFLVVFITIFFIRGNNALSSGGMIALLVLAPGIWKYFKPPEETPFQKKEIQQELPAHDFSVLHFNVKENNKHILSVAEAAISSGADVVSMQELNAVSLQKIDTIMQNKYPFSIIDISIPGFGMAVYSKFPIVDKSVIKDHDFPMLTGTIAVHGRAFQFLGVTTSTPTNDADYQRQLKQFKIVAEIADSLQSTLILMGDLNSVPWSEQIKELTKQTKLEDSRTDLSATFPAQSFLQIPIDYIFHSNDITCNYFVTLKGTSSNHLGIIGYYQFKK